MQAKNTVPLTSVRDLFGKDLLPGLSSAAMVISATSDPWDLISTEDLMLRILREYRERDGVALPKWLHNEAYGEWLCVNSKRLAALAREVEDPLLERTLKSYAVPPATALRCHSRRQAESA